MKKKYNGNRDVVVRGRFTKTERDRIRAMCAKLSFSNWVMQQVERLEKEQDNG